MEKQLLKLSFSDCFSLFACNQANLIVLKTENINRTYNEECSID